MIIYKKRVAVFSITIIVFIGALYTYSYIRYQKKYKEVAKYIKENGIAFEEYYAYFVN